MDQSLIYGLTAALVIGLLSLGGAITFSISERLLSRVALFLVAFSTGALIGGAFFHLIPEALEIAPVIQTFGYLIVGIAIFFVLERYLKWRHCHDDGDCEVHTFTHMSILGDGLHNFIDGLVIISSFSISIELGIITAIAMAAHELPQELGDFGVLVHGGYSRRKALGWNFVTALTAILGVLVGYFLISSFEYVNAILLPVAAGGFIYIAMSDLVPELHKEPKISKSVLNFMLFLAGIGFMLLVKLYGGR